MADDPEQKAINRLISRWEGKKDNSPVVQETRATRDKNRMTVSEPRSNADAPTKGVEFVKETLNTPVIDSCDVLIIGGGPAGMCSFRFLGASRGHAPCTPHV
jgi:hypothetical protein